MWGEMKLDSNQGHYDLNGVKLCPQDRFLKTFHNIVHVDE